MKPSVDDVTVLRSLCCVHCPACHSLCEVGGGALAQLQLLQVSLGLQVSVEEGEQAEVFPAERAAVWRFSAVDAAVPQEAGRHLEGLGAERAAVRLLVAVREAVLPQQLLQPVAPPTQLAVERLLARVSAAVDAQLRRAGELFPADVAGDDGGVGRQLVRVFADDVVLQAAVAPPTHGAQLALAGVHGLVAAQVGGLREAPPTGGAAVRPLVQVHQLVARQVSGVEEAPPTHVAGEGLVEVRDAVRLEDAGGAEAPPTDVAVAALLARVPRPHVQVAVRSVAERLGAEVAGERQQPVSSPLVLTQLQHAAEALAARRAQGVGLPVVGGESLCVWKQHGALRAAMVNVRRLCGRSHAPIRSPIAACCGNSAHLGRRGGGGRRRGRPSVLVVGKVGLRRRGGGGASDGRSRHAAFVLTCEHRGHHRSKVT